MTEPVRDSIAQIAAGENQTALLYAAISGLMISEMVPTPATAIAYFVQKKATKKDPSQVRQKVATAYNFAAPAWWVLVFGAVHFYRGDFTDKAKLAAFLVGGGAAVGLIFNKKISHLLPNKNNTT